jgi:hypothetical protein
MMAVSASRVADRCRRKRKTFRVHSAEDVAAYWPFSKALITVDFPEFLNAKDHNGKKLKAQRT